MKSWKTTLCGAIAALGTYLAGVHDPAWIATAGQLLLAAGTTGVGFFARDNDKSSEKVGAK